jgi:hypothetical protein
MTDITEYLREMKPVGIYYADGTFFYKVLPNNTKLFTEYQLKEALKAVHHLAMEGYYESIVQAKSEVLLEAADIADGYWVDTFSEYQSYTLDVGDKLRKMAEEIK